MNRMAVVLAVLCLGGVPALLGCGPEAASDLTIERLPDVEPSLPAVPTLPPPPHEIQYGDSSYSVYGVRRRAGNTMDTDVEITGYIVEIYEPPECPEEDNCPPPPAPHMWIADTPDETERENRLTVVGYAENHAQIEEAIADAERGREQEIPEGSGLLPIPTDFAVGAKIKLQGRFTRVSGTGFNISDGLLDYGGHEILEPAPGSEEEDDS